MNTKTYDPKCYDLAAVFLGDHPEKHTEGNIDKLAAYIQDQIEDWIATADPGQPVSNGARATTQGEQT